MAVILLADDEARIRRLVSDFLKRDGHTILEAADGRAALALLEQEPIDLAILEANHDVEMLKRGPYPPQTKLRIMSDVGHISNNTCATEVKRLFETGQKDLF